MKTDNIKHKTIVAVFFTFLTLFISCNEKKATATEEHTEEENKTEVALSDVQYKTVGIETGGLENRNLNTIIKANGYTTVPPQNMANVSTLISGVVKDIYVLEGTFVTKGKTLATIQNLEVVEMLEDYKSANATIEYLQLEYNRQKLLSDENVNARKIFQEIKSKLAVERARAQASKTKLQALNVGLNSNSSIIPIISPISGYVGKINTSKGAFAETGTPLFEVVDNSQMHLDLNVYEKDLGKIAVGQTIEMLDKIIQFSIKNKFIILLFTLVLIAFGSYSIKIYHSMPYQM
jgi:cobalt-zinc-cadmium efflux system membrane fusion protein